MVENSLSEEDEEVRGVVNWSDEADEGGEGERLVGEGEICGREGGVKGRSG